MMGAIELDSVRCHHSGVPIVRQCLHALHQDTLRHRGSTGTTVVTITSLSPLFHQGSVSVLRRTDLFKRHVTFWRELSRDNIEHTTWRHMYSPGL